MVEIKIASVIPGDSGEIKEALAIADCASNRSGKW